MTVSDELRRRLAVLESAGATQAEIDAEFKRYEAEHHPLTQAYLERGVDGLREALRNGADANEKDLLGTPALCVVAARGDTVGLVALLEAGADIEGCGDSPLVYAANAGARAAVALLLSRGADPMGTNCVGYRASQRVPGGERELREVLVDAERAALVSKEP